MKIGFIFPGQGSQSIGMLSELADAFPSVRQHFEQASDVLRFDLWHLVQQGEAAELNQTQNTQPAMLAADIAVYRVWQEQGGPAGELLAGHSLGEYAALVAAESLSFEDAIQLVALRGRLMQNAVPEGQGAMAAILGLPDQTVIDICQSIQEGVVEAVNFNAPGQVVIAGHRSAVRQASEAAKKAGAKRALILPVSVPSHCSLMKPAAQSIADHLSDMEIKSPQIPVLHNVDAQSSQDPDRIRQYLAEQLYRPVQWVKTIQTMQDSGLDALIESGPGKVLTNLTKRINAMPCFPILDTSTLNRALEAVHD